MADFIKSYQSNVGLNHVPAYQVSGRPFVESKNAGSAAKVDFPYVTRWFQVLNNSSSPVRVGFSQAGVEGATNFFQVDASGSSGIGKSEVYEMKISELWLSGSTQCAVVAGLTTVPTARVTTSDGPSWSGSSGVG